MNQSGRINMTFITECLIKWNTHIKKWNNIACNKTWFLEIMIMQCNNSVLYIQQFSSECLIVMLMLKRSEVYTVTFEVFEV